MNPINAQFLPLKKQQDYLPMKTRPQKPLPSDLLQQTEKTKRKHHQDRETKLVASRIEKFMSNTIRD